MSTGLRARSRSLRRLAADRRGVDRRGVDRALLRVPGPVVRAHRHREQLARGPALGRPDPLRVRDGDRLRVRRERAERGHARRVCRGDHGPRSGRPELRVAAGRRRRTRRRRAAQRRSAVGSPAQSSSSSTFADDRRRPLDQRPQRPRRPCGPDDATPTRRPLTNRRLTKTSALATFWWISRVGEPRQRRLARHHERFGLRRAGGLGRPDDLALRERGVLSAGSSPGPRTARSRHHPHPHVAEPCARDAVTDVPGLARLALAAVRRAPHPPGARRRPRRPSSATARR